MRGNPRPVSERFEEKYIPEPNSGCWLCDDSGYGRLLAKGKGFGLTPAHRVSWTLYHGPIPDGMCVLHKCDNPPCVNPDHLFLGTKKDNNDDKMRKGRHKPGRGERHWKVKLTEAEVLEIRKLAIEENGEELALKFGVTSTNIRYIRQGKTWKHLTEIKS